MKTRAIICGVFIVLIGSVLVDRSRAATPEKIRFPYSPIAWQSVPWWMAKESGLYEKYGLDVEIFFEGASSVIAQTMLAGETNFAGIAGPSIVNNVLAGGDIIQVAAVIKSFTTPMYSQSAIKERAQLKGQKVGVSPLASVSHLTAQSVLQRAGVTGVTIIQTGGIPESAAALSSGNVAAAMVPPPQSVLLREKGFHELVGAKQLREMNIPFVENGLATRRSYGEKNPEQVKRFIKASFEGIRRMFDNKDLTMKTIAKYTKITDEKMLEESYRFAVDAISKDATVPHDAMEALIDQLVNLKTIEAPAAKKFAATAYYENRYVNELEREGFFKKLWQ